jgi:hypothetical protein
MLNATKKKLLEADFFFLKLKREEVSLLRADSEARDFYLSAFLTAGRSVGDAIVAEGGESYKTWFASRRAQLSPDEAGLLAFTNEQRVKTVHVRGADVTHATREISLREVQLEISRRGGIYEVYGGGVPGAPIPPMDVQVTNLMFDYQGRLEPVVSIGERWLRLMQGLVEEYERSLTVVSPLSAVSGSSGVLATYTTA